MNTVNINMPQDVKFIIATLEKAGFEGYAVGGCVRDAILGRQPQDWDITTSALPWQIKQLFPRTVDTGILHGTVTVMIGRTGYEVTTFRIDGEYEDMRHPKSVEFSKNLREDLKRRDFTINAMAYNDKAGLVDEFGGRKDLKEGVIRCVGEATERFTEDALRMMRAIRFAAQLGFTIEKDTWDAIIGLAPNIGRVSRERIAVELGKTLMSDRPEYVQLYSKCNIASVVLPQLDKALNDKESDIALAAVHTAAKKLPLRYAALMNYQGADSTRSLLKELKLDNNTVRLATMLTDNSNLQVELNECSVRRALNKFGKDNLLLILENQENIILAKEQVIGLPLGNARNHIGRLRAMINLIVSRGDCYTIAGLAVTGSDIMDLGFTGPAVGKKLNELLEMVIENPAINDRETLLSTQK